MFGQHGGKQRQTTIRNDTHQQTTQVHNSPHSQYIHLIVKHSRPPSCFSYLLCKTLQALVGAAHHHVLPKPHQTDRVGRQLDAVLWCVRLPATAQTQIRPQWVGKKKHSGNFCWPLVVNRLVQHLLHLTCGGRRCFHCDKPPWCGTPRRTGPSHPSEWERQAATSSTSTRTQTHTSLRCWDLYSVSDLWSNLMRTMMTMIYSFIGAEPDKSQGPKWHSGLNPCRAKTCLFVAVFLTWLRYSFWPPEHA